jgi:O-Antigen ligase
MNPQKIINKIFAFFLVLLPISNPIQSLLVKKLNFPSIILYWKEVLIIIVSLIFFTILFKTKKIYNFKFTLLFLISLLLVLFSSIINNIPLNSYLIGFRFELLFLMLLTLGLDYSRLYSVQDISKPLYIGIILSSIINFFSLILGEKIVFNFFKLTESFEGTNALGTQLCHSINGLDYGCRFSGGFSNPNHYGAYLIFVIPFLIYQVSMKNKRIVLDVLLLVISIIFLYLNNARFALVSLFIMLIIFGIKKINFIRFKTLAINITLLFTLIFTFGIFLIPPNNSFLDKLPQQLGKPASSIEHYRLTNISIDIIKKNLPVSLLIGYGLGQSGPASKMDYTNTVNLKIVKENQEIADKYYTFYDRMTVPESWYLQLIINGGLLYAIIYILIITHIFKSVYKKIENRLLVLTLSILGILIGNIYLHIFESSIIAIYFSIISIYLNQFTTIQNIELKSKKSSLFEA